MSDVSAGPDRVIQVMPETLANKIAAGEVVQRPASAAKELIENAIDAGAGHVQVILKGAGSTLIHVIDDGCGMSAPDAAACFRRHATSKIRSIEDLERIQTLGFRGEALASIASVSQVELKTRRMQDEAGTLIRVEGGTVTASEPCATPPGTSLAIRNLFYNVPARRNFLKTPATEFKHLVETFQFLALAHPTVGFSLIHDEHDVYRLPSAQGVSREEALRQRIGDLMGPQHAEEAVWVEEATSYLSVEGFISRPEFHRRSRGEQFLFVNERFIKNRSLDHAVLHAYEDLLPDGTYPFYALFLRLDPSHVDVNVHPTKAEVKFDDERGLYSFLRAVVRKGLGTVDLTPQLEMTTEVDPPGPPRAAARPTPFLVPGGEAPRSVTPRPHTAIRATAPSGFASPRSTTAPGDLSDMLYGVQAGNEHEAPPAAPGDTEPRAIPSGAMAGDLEIPDQPEGEPLLWQLHNRYVLTQIRSGLMILDQHAAHERILYERAMQSLESGFGLSQQLLFPHTLDFSPGDFELVRELLPDIRSLGFDIEEFSGRSMVVRGVPTDIGPGDARTLLDDILQQYKTYQSDLQIKGRENLAKSIAHRSAIRPGDKLSTKAMRTLIDQLFMCEMPYASPHGRPTIIKISIEELDKRLGRSG